MQLAYPYLLLLLLLAIPYIIWYVLRHHASEPTLQVSSTAAYRTAPRTWRQALVHAPFLLRLLAFAMIVIVLARPQTSNSWSDRSVEGIDIMLAVDVSTSMLAEDLRPNRLEAAKKVASELSRHMAEILKGRDEIELFLPPQPEQSGVLSLRVRGRDCEEIAALLGRDGICVRSGLHCAPLAHRSAGTLDTGTVRMSFSPFNTHAEVEKAAAKLIKII